MRQEIYPGRIGGRTNRKTVALFVKTCEDLFTLHYGFAKFKYTLNHCPVSGGKYS